MGGNKKLFSLPNTFLSQVEQIEKKFKLAKNLQKRKNVQL